jgi:hypothetical protein
MTWLSSPCALGRLFVHSRAGYSETLAAQQADLP